MWHDEDEEEIFGNGKMTNKSSFEVEQGGFSHGEYEDTGHVMGGSSSGNNKSQKCLKKAICWLLTLGLLGACAGLGYIVFPQLFDFTGSSSSSTPTNVKEENIIHHNSYNIIFQIPVESVEGDVIVYQHKKTLTPIMTILPYDTTQDNTFAINFRTKPENSHGTPHVLEHSLLSGSKKYPVKDPFTEVREKKYYTTMLLVCMPCFL